MAQVGQLTEGHGALGQPLAQPCHIGPVDSQIDLKGGDPLELGG
jgi:hypothetical protein